MSEAAPHRYGIPETYTRVHARKDKHRLAQALRAEADRLDGEAKRLWYVQYPEDRGFSVTDHAVVRFLERVMGINIDAVREQIARLVPSDCLPVKCVTTLNDHGVLIVDGFKFVVTPNSLITVLTEDMEVSVEYGLLNREDFVDSENASPQP